MEPPKTDQAGLKYYDHLPVGFRQATMDDYERGLFKHNTAYLMYGFHSRVYYPKRVKIMLHPDALEFIELGNVYIYTG